MKPHEVLGLSNNATPDEIKAAYRKLAMKHHPDRNGNSEESRAEFLKVQQAYDALTKPQPIPEHNHPFRHSGFAWAFGDEDVWQRTKRNSDFTVRAAISLEQAHNGSELSISVNDKIVTVKIPRGVQHGQKLTLDGEGGREYSDLPAGNLVLIVMIRPHAIFERSGDDLYIGKEIDVIEMMTGCSIEIISLTGEKLSVNIPEGSKPSTRLRLSNKGMPAANDKIGSLFVVLNPIFPVLSVDEIERLRKVRVDSNSTVE